jgi:hypothetical protein
MRKLYSLIVVFLLVSINTLGQDFAPIGAEWYYCVPNEIGNPLYSYERFVSIKDTVINDRICRIIESDNTKEIFYQNHKKIFYLFANDFHLIYDFDVQMNDTVTFGFKSYSESSYSIDTVYSVNCVINDIDTIFSDTTQLLKVSSKMLKNKKLAHLVWPSEYDYTEKIGYEYDFMQIIPFPTLGFMRNLRCYNDNEISFETMWWKTQEKECNYKLSTSIMNNLQENEVIVYPNPTSGQIIIDTEKLVETIKLFDITGKLKKTTACKYIDISDFSNGQYLMTVNFANGQSVNIKVAKNSP